jgi:hypothetical protein
VKTRTKLSAALLATAAASMLSTAASADELATLKAQLEALQSRVNTIESAPAAPSNAGYLSYERGFGGNSVDRASVQDAALTNTDAGYTIAITPTADMPAPVAEITVYGYVGAHIAYDFDRDYGSANSFSISAIGGATPGDHIGLTAKQSRFGIRSRIDTAIGQLRTHISLDFATADGNSGSLTPRMRHAVGYWDMTPNWTFSMGQDDFTAALLPIGVATVDFAGPLLTSSRAAQMRLSYRDGPLYWAVALESPTFDSETNMPNIASYIQYDIAGGHTIIVTGEVADWDGDRAGLLHNDELGWAVLAGANINLGDVATLTAGFGYGEGLLDQKFMGGIIHNGVAGTSIDANGDPLETLGFLVGLSFGLSDTTTFNALFSYASNEDGAPRAGQLDNAWKVQANILWQPVRQMRMGWEVIYAEKEFLGGFTDDGVRATFGTWFFF